MEAMHEVRLRVQALKAAMSAQKALQEAKTDTMKLLDGTPERTRKMFPRQGFIDLPPCQMKYVRITSQIFEITELLFCSNECCKLSACAKCVSA